MTGERASDAARSGVLVVRESAREVLVVSGPDRVTWLNGVVTCDVAAVGREQAAFGLLLNKLGKIQTDFYVLASEDSLLLACAPGTLAQALGELERMLVMEDAELGPPPVALECLALHGPRAVELLGSVQTNGAVGARLDRTGLGGAVLLLPASEVAATVDGLVRAGAVLADDEDWLGLRVERQVGSFGTDYGASDNPHEAGLERRAIAWNKGCYLGQEVVFMQDARGKVKRRLVELAIEGPVPPVGAKVSVSGGDVAGEVTSAARSAILGSAVALARVKAPEYEPGTSLLVGGARAQVRGEPV